MELDARAQLSDAALLLDADLLVGQLRAAREDEDVRDACREYVAFLTRMADQHVARAWEADELRAAITALSHLRRALAAEVRGGAVLGAPQCSGGLAALVWLGVPQDPRAAGGLTNHVQTQLRRVQERLTLLSRAYTETENTPESTAAMLALGSIGVHSEARYALVAPVVTLLADHVMAAAAARRAAALIGRVGEEDAVARASKGRSDAYVCRRLHAVLSKLLGFMLMGAASRAEAEGLARDQWPETRTGAAVLAFRRWVRAQLIAHDRSKRAAAKERGRTYIVQTSAAVALLQDMFAAMMAQMRKDGDALRDALLDGLARPHLLLVHNLHGLGDDAAAAVPMTFWQAVRAVCQLRRGGGVFSCFEASAIVAAAVVFDDAPSDAAPSSAPSRSARVVELLPELHAAAAAAADRWPSAERFYGRDYAHTDRKDAAKRRNSGRDEAETGEWMGFRPEWAAYMAGHHVPTEVRTGAPLSRVRPRLQAAVLTAARAAALADDEGGLPTSASATGVHAAHALALEAMPCVRLSRPTHLLTAPLRALQLDAGTNWRGGFETCGVDCATWAYRHWSGGAILVDLFPEFFAVAWRRLHDAFSQPGSAWFQRVQEWSAAARGEATVSGRSKFMHPYRLMLLLRGVARTLLDEKTGPNALTGAEVDERVALRLQRAVLQGIIDRIAYPPWAGLMVDQFCRCNGAARSLARASASAPTPAPAAKRARPDPSLSPSLRKAQERERGALMRSHGV